MSLSFVSLSLPSSTLLSSLLSLIIKRDQETLLSNKTEEIKKILSSIPESKYVTMPSTAIKATSSNTKANSNINPSTAATMRLMQQPMTPYSFIDSISSNISTIKMARNTDSYNPNMIDILTIKQRLDGNNDYNTIQQVYYYDKLLSQLSISSSLLIGGRP